MKTLKCPNPVKRMRETKAGPPKLLRPPPRFWMDTAAPLCSGVNIGKMAPIGTKAVMVRAKNRIPHMLAHIFPGNQTGIK